MRKAVPKRSNLFLLELILAIFFFALASAVCIRLFVQARSLTQETHAQNQALTCAKNVSALFEATEGSLEEIIQEYPEGKIEDSRLEIYYDKEWQPCAQEKGIYLLTLTLSDSSFEGRLLKGQIQVTWDKETLCRLDVSCYTPIKAGE